LAPGSAEPVPAPTVVLFGPDALGAEPSLSELLKSAWELFIGPLPEALPVAGALFELVEPGAVSDVGPMVPVVVSTPLFCPNARDPDRASAAAKPMVVSFMFCVRSVRKTNNK